MSTFGQDLQKLQDDFRAALLNLQSEHKVTVTDVRVEVYPAGDAGWPSLKIEVRPLPATTG